MAVSIGLENLGDGLCAIILADVRNCGVGSLDLIALVINDVVNAAVAVQLDGERVVEFDSCVLRNNDTGRCVDKMVPIEGVDTSTPGLVLLHIITDLVARETSIAVFLINIIWKL